MDIIQNRPSLNLGWKESFLSLCRKECTDNVVAAWWWFGDLQTEETEQDAFRGSNKTPLERISNKVKFKNKLSAVWIHLLSFSCPMVTKPLCLAAWHLCLSSLHLNLVPSLTDRQLLLVPSLTSTYLLLRSIWPKSAGKSLMLVLPERAWTPRSTLLFRQ